MRPQVGHRRGFRSTVSRRGAVAGGAEAHTIPGVASDGKLRVVVAGGGIAGLEAMMALHDLAGDLVELTLVAPEADFTFKPMIVEEPFSLTPAERRELAPIAAEHGAKLVQKAVTSGPWSVLNPVPPSMEPARLPP